MGIEIVKAATVYGRRLSGNAYKVLVAMSLSALDKPSNGRPARRYFAGWDALAVALGYEPGTGNDRNSAGHKAVKRAIRELRNQDHISPLLEACRGTRQSYDVHPGGIGKGDQSDPVKGDQIDPVKGDQNGPQRGTKTVLPRKDTGSSSDLPQDISITSVTKPQTARPTEKQAEEKVKGHRFKGTPGDDCETCGKSSMNRPAHPVHLIYGTA